MPKPLDLPKLSEIPQTVIPHPQPEIQNQKSEIENPAQDNAIALANVMVDQLAHPPGESENPQSKIQNLQLLDTAKPLPEIFHPFQATLDKWKAKVYDDDDNGKVKKSAKSSGFCGLCCKSFWVDSCLCCAKGGGCCFFCMLFTGLFFYLLWQGAMGLVAYYNTTGVNTTK